MSGSIAPYYADWAGYQRRIVDALGAMSDEDLALIVEVNGWPIWAAAAHTAGARVWWLCHMFGEPGMETTPFTDPTGMGWEDDLSVVRTRDEVVGAWESSWGIVKGCLERWTPAMLGETVRRTGAAGVAVFSRESTLMRLITHEAYHAGEISLTLARNGREPIDLWPNADWLEGAASG
jgi:uncharacterized damage-inducible protein DinB